MKARFESPEILELYVRLDLNYIRLEEIQKEKLSPLELMIDKATGYDKEKLSQVIEIMKDIIYCKKKVEADYSDTEKVLEKLESLK